MVDFLESLIKAVEVNSDGYRIFVGTGNGELASFDMRTGLIQMQYTISSFKAVY